MVEKLQASSVKVSTDDEDELDLTGEAARVMNLDCAIT